MAPNSEPDRDFPWWLVILAVAGLWLLWEMLSDDVYRAALRTLGKGVWITVGVSVFAYLGACLIGLALGGTAGLGTAIFAFGTGPVLAITLPQASRRLGTHLVHEV